MLVLCPSQMGCCVRKQASDCPTSELMLIFMQKKGQKSSPEKPSAQLDCVCSCACVEEACVCLCVRVVERPEMSVDSENCT